MKTSAPIGLIAKRAIKFVSKGARLKRVQKWRQEKEQLRIAEEKEFKLKVARAKVQAINNLRERIDTNLNKLNLKQLTTAEHLLSDYTIHYDDVVITAGGNFGDAIDSLHKVRKRIKDLTK